MFKEEKVPSEQPVKAKRFYGTYVAGTSMLIYFFTNGMALFIPPNLFPRLIEEFQATAAAVSTTVAITHLVAALLAPFVGHLVDRFGVIRHPSDPTDQFVPEEGGHAELVL